MHKSLSSCNSSRRSHLLWVSQTRSKLHTHLDWSLLTVCQILHGQTSKTLFQLTHTASKIGPALPLFKV